MRHLPPLAFELALLLFLLAIVFSLVDKSENTTRVPAPSGEPEFLGDPSADPSEAPGEPSADSSATAEPQELTPLRDLVVTTLRTAYDASSGGFDYDGDGTPDLWYQRGADACERLVLADAYFLGPSGPSAKGVFLLRELVKAMAASSGDNLSWGLSVQPLPENEVSADSPPVAAPADPSADQCPPATPCPLSPLTEAADLLRRLAKLLTRESASPPSLALTLAPPRAGRIELVLASRMDQP